MHHFLISAHFISSHLVTTPSTILQSHQNLLSHFPHFIAMEVEETRKGETGRRGGQEETQALSWDQVNDNADELIELRGEGRYFGVTDPELGDAINSQQVLGPLCGNCHMRGHIRSKCKTVVCHKCGKIGDHYETQCPTTMTCARCGVKGHRVAECKSKHPKKREYCSACDTFSHGDASCPLIWRSYLTSSSKAPRTLPVMGCYNCGSDKHYGDDCPRERVLRVPNFGLAFSGNNLPQQLRQMYFDRLRQKSGKWDRLQQNHGSRWNGSGGHGPKLYLAPALARNLAPSLARNLAPNLGRNLPAPRGNGRNYQAKPTPNRLGTISKPGSKPAKLRLGTIKKRY